MFCRNCGRKLADGAKFCDECGEKVAVIEEAGKRKEFYDGEVHKCPKCGEVLNAFSLRCDRCKYELRGIKSSDSVQEFSLRLEKAKNEQQRINLIRGVAIPNTKEDIVEFMTLAVANFDAEYYVAHLDEEDVSDAWLAKIEQCYQKAKLSFGDEEMTAIERLYQTIKQKKDSASRKKHGKTILAIGMILFGLGLMALQNYFYPIGFFGIPILIIGIVLLRKKNKQAKDTIKQDTKNEQKSGFSSWSGFGKFMWIVLNIYTLGIPAIIYACSKK